MNLFKARTRPSNLYATTEEENVQIRSWRPRIVVTLLASIMWVQIEQPYEMIAEPIILYKKHCNLNDVR